MKCITIAITIIFFLCIAVYAIIKKNHTDEKNVKEDSVNMRLLMVQLALFIVVFVTITYYVETFINENAALMYPFLLILIYIFYDILFDIWFNNQELSKGEKNGLY